MMIRIVAVLLAFTLLSCVDKNEPKRNYKTLIVKAAAEKEFVPDIATFQINLECTKSSTSASRDCLVEKSNSLNDKLMGFGIAEKDILTTSITMNRDYTWRNNSRVFLGYKATTTAVITVRDLSTMDKIYSDLLDDENTNLYGLNYELSEMDSLKNEVYLKALDNANKLADKLASKLPGESLEILQIGNVELKSSSEGRVQDARNAMAVTEEKVEQSSYISINKGTIPVRVNLYVEYLIE